MEPLTGFWFDAAAMCRELIGNWPFSLSIFVFGLFEPRISRSLLAR
jgi:hypothetical protein